MAYFRMIVMLVVHPQYVQFLMKCWEHYWQLCQSRGHISVCIFFINITVNTVHVWFIFLCKILVICFFETKNRNYECPQRTLNLVIVTVPSQGFHLSSSKWNKRFTPCNINWFFMSWQNLYLRNKIFNHYLIRWIVRNYWFLTTKSIGLNASALRRKIILNEKIMG